MESQRTGAPGFVEPALLLSDGQCGGLLGPPPGSGAGLLALACPGGPAGSRVRVLDGVDVGAQLCGGAAAIRAGTGLRDAGRGGGGIPGGLRGPAGEPVGSPAVAA